MRRSTGWMLAFGLGLLHVVPAAAQNAAVFYDGNCAPCHTIGGGPQGGPDLKDVTARRDRQWLVRFLLDPEAFADDLQVVRMIEEAGGMTMPPVDGLNREMAERLLDLIEERSRAAEGQPAAEEPPVTPAEIARGQALFVGTSPLSAGGSTCVSCHHAADLPMPGGRLGPDLTGAAARLGGARGVAGWLGATPTPMMHALYQDAPLTRDESRALAAFLTSPAPGSAVAPRRGLGVAIGGVSGAMAVLLLAGAAGARRFRAVRAPMVNRGRVPSTPPPRSSPGEAALHHRMGSTDPRASGGPQ